jgi:L-alanine-DL-glutamate epimerase-like enolase superfamily enzyme
MKVRSLEVIPFRIPFARSIELSTGRRDAVEHLLVRVRTDLGAVGHAECVARPTLYGETLASAVAVLEKTLAPLVVDRELEGAHAGARAVAGIAANHSAKAAVELALFDAYCRELEVPAHRLLGGFTTRVPVCPMVGYGSVEEVVTEATELRTELGVGTIKFKVGGDVEHDAAVAVGLRQGLGAEARIYPDANQRFSAAEAVRFLDRCDDAGLRWFEEPCPAAELFGRRQVADRLPARVIGDESCTDARSAAVELLAGRSAGVSIKIARTGIAESIRIRELCAALGAPTLIGSQGDSAIGAACAAAFAASAPETVAEAAEVVFYRGLEDDLFTESLSIEAGALVLSEAPGFGFEIDPDKLAHFRVDI